MTARHLGPWIEAWELAVTGLNIEVFKRLCIHGSTNEISCLEQQFTHWSTFLGIVSCKLSVSPPAPHSLSTACGVRVTISLILR